MKENKTREMEKEQEEMMRRKLIAMGLIVKQKFAPKTLYGKKEIERIAEDLLVIDKYERK